MENFIVATANTHWGEMLRAPDGLSSLAAADVILLQEIIDPVALKVDEQLIGAGFTPPYIAPQYGLLLAVRTASILQPIPNTNAKYQLRKMNVIEHALNQRWAGRPHDFKARGLIATRFRTPSDREVTVATTHPTIPLKPRARAVQILRIGQILTSPDFDGALILAGDMNHYPGPRPVDEGMRIAAGLTRVDIGNEPTWQATGTRQEQYLKFPARVQHRELADYNGQNDAILYRGAGLQLIKASVVTIHSDHRAIIATFGLSREVDSH